MVRVPIACRPILLSIDISTRHVNHHDRVTGARNRKRDFRVSKLDIPDSLNVSRDISPTLKDPLPVIITEKPSKAPSKQSPVTKTPTKSTRLSARKPTLDRCPRFK